MIAIIGAGLTGLSVARLLPARQCRVFEREAIPGGLCRSEQVEGFTFDWSGHLLHVRDAGLRRRLGRLLPGMLQRHVRNASVHACGCTVPYPFQANLHGLPPEVVRECVTGFVRALYSRPRSARNPDFLSWVLATFGEGIARHFFIPYNEKLWLRSLEHLTIDWARWSIPRPGLDEVIGGALGISTTGMGYNPTFLYPRSGGIGVLPETLAKRLRNITFGKLLTRVNLRQREITFQDGETLHYDRLVSTVPLPALLHMIEDLPTWAAQAGNRFEWVSVCNCNLGINRAGVTPYHWVYFPERVYPFYRVGCYSNFSDGMAPPGTSSLYVEVATRPAQVADPATLEEAVAEGLRRCGMLRRRDRIVVSRCQHIRCAYVVHDSHRQRLLPRVLDFLATHGVSSAGRYGAWEYSSMEQALRTGAALAGNLRA